MRSSDLFYGLFATMAGFFVVVALAAGIGGSVIVIPILAAALSLHLMFSRASQAPQVLLVGRRRGRPLNVLESEFDVGGFATAHCAGPRSRPCPVLAGRPCPIRAQPSATVAYLEDATTPLPPCEQYFHVPTVAVDEGAAVTHRPGAARQLSWQEGTRATLTAVRELTSVR